MRTKKELTKIRKTVSQRSGELSRVLRALGDPRRVQIFHLLTNHRNMCVTDMAAILHISIPAASQQLKILEMTGLVRKEREGQMMCYELRRGAPLVGFLVKLFSRKGRVN